MNEFVELRHLLTLFLKRWPIILLGAVVGGGLAFGVSQKMSPVYRAKTTLLVGQPIQAGNVDSRDIQTSEQLALTYAEIGRRQPVLQETVETLDLDMTWQQLQERVSFRPVEGTQLLDLTVEAGSRETARWIADELARQLILLSGTSQTGQEPDETNVFIQQRVDSLRERIERGQSQASELEAALASAETATEMSEIQDELGVLERLITDWESSYAQLMTLSEDQQRGNFNLLGMIDPAHVEPSPVWPRVNLNILLGIALGLLFTSGIVVWRDYWDESLQSLDDLGSALGLAPLGAVNKIKGREYQDKLITSLAPFAPASEAYRMIRSNIRFISEEQPCRTILVTSASFGEGKSLTVANLGLAMAHAGNRTIIVDADLRRPIQHEIFGVPNKVGLTELLRSQELDFDSHVVETSIELLSLLPSGELPPNPSELLSSDYTELLVARLEEMADTIILDGPPTLRAADAALLSSQVDGVVLVVEAGRTERRVAQRTVSILRQAGASLLGVVLNRAPHSRGIPGYEPYGSALQHDKRTQSDGSNWLRRPAHKAAAHDGAHELTGNGQGYVKSKAD